MKDPSNVEDTNKRRITKSRGFNRRLVKTQESWKNYNMLQPNMGYNVPDRCPRAHARANIYFFNVRSSATHCHRTRSQFFWDHIQVWTCLHGDTSQWRSRLFLSRDYLKSSALPEELCVIWMASCVPLCSHVLKIFLNVKTLPRLHYLLPRSCQLFSSRQQPVWDASCAEG